MWDVRRRPRDASRGGHSGAVGAIIDVALAYHPYRTQLAGDPAPRPARLSRGWGHAAAVLLIVGGTPAALVGLCGTARAYGGPWLMPTTILYPAIAYAASVLCVCAIDAVRR
jgi:hypothetical protein